MKTAFYITCYNAPDKCHRLLGQLATLPGFKDHQLFLSDQSDDFFAREYARLAVTHGATHLRWPNGGATKAKRTVVDHAFTNDFSFLSQISEDFVFTDTPHPSVVHGRDTLLPDAMALLLQAPHLSFVHWCYFRQDGHKGYFWNEHRSARETLKRYPGVTLSCVEGEVSLFNWPYTGRVRALKALWDCSQDITPVAEQHKKDHAASGGEWALAFVSRGHGACFMAQPFSHPDREKPSGSLP